MATFTLLLNSCSAGKNAVGHEEKNNLILYSNNDIKARWNQLLANNNIKGKLYDVSILPARDTINQENYYYLLGKSANDSIKVAHRLVKRSSKFYLDKKDYPLTVICHGCADAYPSLSFDRWGWSCESQNLDDCKKLVVVNL